MKEKIKNIIDKLTKENTKFKKALDKGLSKYNSSRARQSIQTNIKFIQTLEQTLS